MRDGLCAVPTYNCRNVPEQSCANNDAICVITSAIEYNYIPIEQQQPAAYFSVGSHPQAHIFGPGQTEDCNSWDGVITIILICA
jgi:hypothetical protein